MLSPCSEFGADQAAAIVLLSHGHSDHYTGLTTAIDWLRSDFNGTVTVETDGDKYAVRFTEGKLDESLCPRDCAQPSDF